MPSRRICQVVNSPIENVNDLNPDRVLVCGDWHGSTVHMKAALNLAKNTGCTTVVHVGDLGWRFGTRSEHTFDLPLMEELEKRDLHLVWADGNHDRHDLLRALPLRADGFADCGGTGRLLWAPRAHRWEWSGRVFAAMGGAMSVNYNNLTEGVTVFRALEEVHPEDVERLGTDPVDVMISHEVPAGVPLTKTMSFPFWIEEQAHQSRALLAQAVENTRPKLAFAGHWHQRVIAPVNVYDEPSTDVHVLHMNGHDVNAVVLNVTDLTVTEAATLNPNWQRWTRRAEKQARSRAAREKYRRRIEDAT